MAWSIAEVARMSGVTARTLRHYEDVGLLQPERRGSVRLYSGRDRARLKVALRSKRVGFSLEEIRELFELYDNAGAEAAHLDTFVARLERKQVALEQQREDLDVMLAEIRFFTEHCRRLLQGDTSRS